MTQEEKAKAYDEAIEKAKQTLEASSAPEAKMIVYHFFPELAESDDDMIRKSLIKFLTDIKRISESGRTTWAVRKEDAEMCKSSIAYLEKQKDIDKMIVVSPEVWDEAISDAFENGRKEGEKQKEQKVDTDKLRKDIYQSGYNDGYQHGKEDTQKEQKPNIEICPHSIKSKSYKENGYPIEDCDYGLEIALSILEKTLGEAQGYQTDDGIREHQTAIKAVKDAMKEQKPAEWSEEDEKIIQSLIREIDKYVFFAGIEANKIVNFLKSLRPSWKPGNNTYKTIIHNIFAMLKDLDFDKIAPDHRLSLLYDIRVRCKNADEQAEIFDEPSWKPSEEQMVALHAMNCLGELSYQGQQQLLIDLYQQLKKLM